MTYQRWAEAVAEYQYYSHCGDISALTLRIVSSRLGFFRKVHRNDLKFRAALAGRELK